MHHANMRTAAVIAALAVLVFTMLPINGQQAPAPATVQPPERVIINFILPIDTNSVNMLLAVVNGQIRNGVKKITIILSSPGGDTTSAFAAYNILKNVPAEITTFNVGNIDSAAMLIFCSGKHRYSFPSPARFLIHGNALNLGTGVPLDYNFLDAQLQQIKSLNQMVVQVISATATAAKKTDIENAVHGQTILTPEDAKTWGLVQDIRTSFMEPGAVFVSVNIPDEKKPFEYNVRPTISSGGPPPVNQ